MDCSVGSMHEIFLKQQVGHWAENPYSTFFCIFVYLISFACLQLIQKWSQHHLSYNLLLITTIFSLHPNPVRLLAKFFQRLFNLQVVHVCAIPYSLCCTFSAQVYDQSDLWWSGQFVGSITRGKFRCSFSYISFKWPVIVYITFSFTLSSFSEGKFRYSYTSLSFSSLSSLQLLCLYISLCRHAVSCYVHLF